MYTRPLRVRELVIIHLSEPFITAANDYRFTKGITYRSFLNRKP